MSATVGSNLNFGNVLTAKNLTNPVDPGDAVPLNYLNNLLNGKLDNLQLLDASAISSFPVSQKGQTYYVNSNGVLSGIPVNTGDVIFCLNSGNLASDFSIIQAKLLSATSTEEGKVRLASDLETILGTSNTLAITPASLKATLQHSQVVNVNLSANVWTDFAPDVVKDFRVFDTSNNDLSDVFNYRKSAGQWQIFSLTSETLNIYY